MRKRSYNSRCWPDFALAHKPSCKITYTEDETFKLKLIAQNWRKEYNRNRAKYRVHSKIKNGNPPEEVMEANKYMNKKQ